MTGQFIRGRIKVKWGERAKKSDLKWIEEMQIKWWNFKLNEKCKWIHQGNKIYESVPQYIGLSWKKWNYSIYRWYLNSGVNNTEGKLSDS